VRHRAGGLVGSRTGDEVAGERECREPDKWAIWPAGRSDVGASGCFDGSLTREHVVVCHYLHAFKKKLHTDFTDIFGSKHGAYS
jgi:hypothetical protein